MAHAPKKSLFITGAAGFVGSRLLQRMDYEHYGKVYCLCRKQTPLLNRLVTNHPNITLVVADLFQAERYREQLAEADIVVHLAAITGKAPKAHYFRINTEGTAFFIEQCKKAQIKGFLHFSTIAVHFEKLSNYPYAQSKMAAEHVVANSGLKYTIVRPTIIFGRQSPIWHNFLKMACAPVPFVFGNGRTKIQPIHVDDLVKAVAAIIDGNRFDNASWDLGGNQVVTIEGLVRQIRQKITGQPVRSVVRFPLFPLSAVLRVLEPLALGLLPFTAGQLNSFRCDGVAEANSFMNAMHPQMKSLEKIIDGLVQARAREAMDASLSGEAKRLGKRLTGSVPPEMVIRKYIDAHHQGLIESDRNREWFERIILGATKFRMLFYPAEAYSAVFHRNGLLRKKLVLIAAILECVPDTQASFDKPESGSAFGFLGGLSLKGLAFALALLVSIPMFLPLQILLGASEKKPVEEVSWKN